MRCPAISLLLLLKPALLVRVQAAPPGTFPGQIIVQERRGANEALVADGLNRSGCRELRKLTQPRHRHLRVPEPQTATAHSSPAGTSAAFALPWSTAGLAPGSHLLTVKAFDAPGNAGSANVTVFVQATTTLNDLQAAVVRITSPARRAR